MRFFFLPLAFAFVFSSCNSDGLNAPEDGSAAMGDLTMSVLLDFGGAPDGPPPDDLLGADLSPPYACYGPVSSFPEFANDCGTDADCAVALHQVDCCGRFTSLGIQTKAVPAFQAEEKDFETIHCPALCDCVQGPTFCQDGKTVLPGEQDEITAICFHGLCQTRCP